MMNHNFIKCQEVEKRLKRDSLVRNKKAILKGGAPHLALDSADTDCPVLDEDMEYLSNF